MGSCMDVNLGAGKVWREEGQGCGQQSRRTATALTGQSQGVTEGVAEGSRNRLDMLPDNQTGPQGTETAVNVNLSQSWLSPETK